MQNPIYTRISRSLRLSGPAPASTVNGVDLLEQERLQILSQTLDNRELELAQKEALFQSKLEELEAREQIIGAQEEELNQRAEVIAIRLQGLDDFEGNLY